MVPRQEGLLSSVLARHSLCRTRYTNTPDPHVKSDWSSSLRGWVPGPRVRCRRRGRGTGGHGSHPGHGSGVNDTEGVLSRSSTGTCTSPCRGTPTSTSWTASPTGCPRRSLGSGSGCPASSFGCSGARGLFHPLVAWSVQKVCRQVAGVSLPRGPQFSTRPGTFVSPPVSSEKGDHGSLGRGAREEGPRCETNYTGVQGVRCLGPRRGGGEGESGSGVRTGPVTRTKQEREGRLTYRRK